MTVILAVGNAFDGLNLHGPFEDVEEATEYAEQHFRGDTWEVVPVTPPESDEDGEDNLPIPSGLKVCRRCHSRPTDCTCVQPRWETMREDDLVTFGFFRCPVCMEIVEGESAAELHCDGDDDDDDF